MKRRATPPLPTIAAAAILLLSLSLVPVSPAAGDEAVQLGNIDAGAVDATAIATGAVGTDEISTDAVTSDEIADGSIQLADAGPGFYAAKTSLDYVEVSDSASPLTPAVVSAECADSNDLPLEASCPVGPVGLSIPELRSIDLDNWSDDGLPAAARCQYYNQSNNSQPVKAAIVCIPVPGP